MEAKLRLAGWSRARRVVVFAAPAQGRCRGRDDRRGRRPTNLATSPTAADDLKLWEYAVLVTNADYPCEAIGQLYRDRCDCENGFDELKNQWGWGGFTTHDMHRSQVTARAVALVYNWWSWYVRAANPQARLLLTLTHAAGDQIKSRSVSCGSTTFAQRAVAKTGAWRRWCASDNI